MDIAETSGRIISWIKVKTKSIMKLNKFFFGLLMTPAVMMVGCSDYEDTEVASPEADADAIGAYFESSSVSEQLSPGQTSFNVVLNRASFSEAVNVPVKITANDDNFFSLSANQFVFDAEKQVSSPITVTFNQSTVELQETYSLGLQVADGVKDHLYGAGYTDAVYSMVIDYTWKSDSLASTMVKDEYAGTLDKEGALAAVEIAKDFEVDEEKPSPDYTKNSLVRISSFFATIGKSKAAGKDHIQFVVDKDHKNPQFLTTDYLANNEISLKVNTTKLATGMTQKFAEEKEYPICMDLVGINVEAATAEAKTDNVTYQVTYELYAFDEKADKKYLLSTADDTVPVEGNTQYKAKFEVKFVKASAE
jgi:NADH:ubiquinone oxidoreductase subunit C